MRRETAQSIWFISIFGGVNNRKKFVLYFCIGREFKIRQSMRDKDNNASGKMAARKRFFSLYLFELRLNVAIIFITNSKRYFRHKKRDAHSLINIETNSQLKYFDVSTFLSLFERGAAFHSIHLFLRTDPTWPRFGEESVSYACSNAKRCSTFSVTHFVIVAASNRLNANKQCFRCAYLR